MRVFIYICNVNKHTLINDEFYKDFYKILLVTSFTIISKKKKLSNCTQKQSQNVQKNLNNSLKRPVNFWFIDRLKEFICAREAFLIKKFRHRKR